MNLVNIVKYLAKLEGIDDVDFLDDVEVADDGCGNQSIAKWELPFEQPSQSELEAAESAALAQEELLNYKELRRRQYPSIEDQLDQLYWDMIDGTSVWKDNITAIKNRYPKE